MQRARAGLSWTDYQLWLRTIRWTHERAIKIRVLDLEHRVLSSLTTKLVDGTVTGDTTADIARVLDLKVFDPSRAIQFDPLDPSAAPVHRKRMIQVGYSVRVPELGRWVTTTVFTGPVWDFKREGPDVQLVAHGKELLAKGNAKTRRVFPAKTPKTDVIRALLRDAGEAPGRLAIPDRKITTPDRIVVGRMDERWPIAERVARSMNADFFYDGAGTAVLRTPMERPCFTFDARSLMSEVSIERDPEGVRNRWELYGAKPKGSKTRVNAAAVLPDRHPLSSAPGSGLGRNGERHWLIESDENPHVKTKAEAGKRVRKLRDDATRTLTNYSFESIPIPHLDDNDLVRVVTDDGTFLVRMKQWTLPLGIDGAPTMSVGVLRRGRGGSRRPRTLESRPR